MNLYGFLSAVSMSPFAVWTAAARAVSLTRGWCGNNSVFFNTGRPAAEFYVCPLSRNKDIQYNIRR